jgi:hypothetical protein
LQCDLWTAIACGQNLDYSGFKFLAGTRHTLLWMHSGSLFGGLKSRLFEHWLE